MKVLSRSGGPYGRREERDSTVPCAQDEGARERQRQRDRETERYRDTETQRQAETERQNNS